MPKQVVPPECLMTAFKFLYPTLDFTRIDFFDGIPFPYSLGPEDALTIDKPGGGFAVHLKTGRYNPCAPESFYVLAHELVHALQGQKGILGGYFKSWTATYVWCLLASGKGAGDINHPNAGNCFEAEAYHQEDSLRASRFAPCDCSGGAPARSPNYDAALKALAGNAMNTSKTDLTCCIAGVDSPLAILGVVWALFAALIASIVAAILAVVDGIVGILTDICKFFGLCK